MIIPGKVKKRLFEKYGEWAIVTGASSGIGQELATQLASAGFNLIINARQADRLEKLKEKLSLQYGSKIIVVAADLAEQEGITRIINVSRGLSIGLLVASAGYGTSGLFIDSSLFAEINMIRVNCEAVLSLTHYYAQQFAKQKRGGIILLSSIVAFQGVPYAANYAATKAYIQSLAEALARELREHNVAVLAASPGPVKSSFEKRANMKMGTAIQPEQIGLPILKALGRKSVIFPGLLTKVLVYSLRTVPRWVKIRIMEKVMNGFTNHQRN